MVLLAGVTLLSVAVAGAVALLEPASATGKTADKSKPAFTASATAASSPEKRPLRRLVDQAPVRVVGAPFVPNTNPRER